MTDIGKIAGQLRASLDELQAQAAQTTLTTPARRRLEQQIREVIEELAALLGRLDPIRQPTAVFDASNPHVIGRFISLALVAQPRRELDQLDPFYGSGVYAIYYKGDFAPYTPIRGSETPIYVGQAAPSAPNARSPAEQGTKLSARLNEHRRNIAKAGTTLDTAHFDFRALVVQSGSETAAENYLIHLFKPIWNSETDILYGLGKHGDDPETRGNRRSPWDTLHPGRAWAASEKLADAKDITTIEREAQAHFIAHPPFADIQSVLNSFFEELRQV